MSEPDEFCEVSVALLVDVPLRFGELLDAGGNLGLGGGELKIVSCGAPTNLVRFGTAGCIGMGGTIWGLGG